MNYDFMLQKIFDASGDEIFICDSDGNISYKNLLSQKKYPKITNIKKISHLFDFEICILKNEDILSYTPIAAALGTKENFCATVVKQLDNKLYAQYTLTSFWQNSSAKIIILRNDTNIDLSEKYQSLEEKTKKLEDNILASQELKSRLENQIIKTGLINLVSEKVQKYISTDKILKITLNQIKRTFNINDAKFLKKGNTPPKISVKADTKSGKSILSVPVMENKKIYGSLILYKKTAQNTWKNDEIELLQSICSLLSMAFAKEELYKELDSRKNELEKALFQLKDAQLQIVQSEKMAALGQLVAGVAHEINTPLGAITSNLSLLEKLSDKAPNIDKLKDFIKEISPINNEALNRIQNMVKTLKNFTRLDEAKKKKADITEGIKSTVSLLSYETKKQIQIEEEYEKLPLIYCYPDYINQVFMNILLNAIQSINGTGRIKISAKRENENIVISISDTGIGIPAKNLGKIFDFGFTTKKLGEGTGLGLALSKKIIEEHSGTINVRSEQGKGTEFLITLPIDR